MKDKRDYWLDKPANINLLIKITVVICAGLLLADLFYEKHPQVVVEYWFGFYGFYGFIVFCAIVFAGKYLRKLIMRKEDYYDGDTDNE
jgi:hypothetical protein